MSIDLVEKAHARYQHDNARFTDNDAVARSITPRNGGQMVQHQGRTYVVLVGPEGLLAIYRASASGALREVNWCGTLFARVARAAGHRV
jgi:hypothetical protein